MPISRAAALAAVIIVAAGVAGGYAVHHHYDHHGSTPPQPVAASSQSPMPVPSTPAPRDPVLATLDASAPVPSAQGVSARLAGAVRAATGNAHLVGEVVDADTGAQLWSRDALQPEPPASTTKLLTAAAALLALGPDFRLETTTRLAGRTVYLVGGGDPTVVGGPIPPTAPSYPHPASLVALARQTASALGTTHRVRLRLDTSIWSGPSTAPGWKPDYVSEGDITPPSPLEVDEGRIDGVEARAADPTEQAGDAFVALLRDDGVKVIGKPAVATATADSTPLASVSSPPLSELVQEMLTVSDDDLAEALGRAVARHDQQPATFAGAAKAVTARAASLGVPIRGVSLQDTSGLSHLDRVTPAALIAVLRAAISPNHPQLRAIIAGLPVAGLTGTLSARYIARPTLSAAGVVRAKTGTLTGVNALAGLVVDHSGRLLIFAFLASHAPLPGVTVPALDLLATRLSQCGCTG